MSATPQPDTTSPTSVKPLVLAWTAPLPPNGGNPPPGDVSSYYDHSAAETLFGRFMIEWKSWKKDDDYVLTETPWGELECKGWNSLEKAQRWAEGELERRLRLQLEKFTY